MWRYVEMLNPHWFGERDPDLERWEKSKIRWIPKWLKQISLEPFSLNFVLGARRVGKTTGLKLLIRELIERGEKPERIIYVDIDLIPSLEHFQDILFWITSENYRYVFLDEVTSLENWWKPVKGFIDAGRFRNSVLVISGSVSIRLKRQAELFPGRMGRGNVVNVLPLSFPEYFELSSLPPKTENLVKKFSEYLSTGGFPASINEDKNCVRDFISAFESEILKAGLSVEIAFKILHSLLGKIPSALSYQSIAGDIGVDHKTVRNYLEVFENMFLIKVAYWKQGTKVSLRKEKKIFFRDPFILRSFSLWTGVEFLKSALYENVVQEHLYRRFGEIYYYRNGYEIDCIAGDLKVEVKAGKPHRRYPKRILVLDEEDIPRFLIELFRHDEV